MRRAIDLVAIGWDPAGWKAGRAVTSAANPRDLAFAIESLVRDSGDLLVVWDATRPRPDPDLLEEIAASPGDLWHAGGAPLTENRFLNELVAPIHMWNVEAPADVAATSWRVTLGAFLTRQQVLVELGHVDPMFESLIASGVEFGRRLLSHGALVRTEPRLRVAPSVRSEGQPSLRDQVLLVRKLHGPPWAAWAAWRSWRRSGDLAGHVKALVGTRGVGKPRLSSLDRLEDGRRFAVPGSVSVLIPTLDRYQHLRSVLSQLRDQTVKPIEVIVVDQTQESPRDRKIAADYADLNLRYVERDTPGQSSARNAGIAEASGEAILFLDDDVELPPGLIADHLRAMEHTGCDVSCGIVDEVGAGPPPPTSLFMRTSNVLPLGNSLIQRQALSTSGLLDLAFDKGARADHDLGMRLHSSGALMILNPDARLLHLRAPRGGLRSQRARVVTYHSSRNTFTDRHIVSPTEAYLWLRYFGDDLVPDAIALRVLGTFSRKGSVPARVTRALLAAALLPDTVRKTRRAIREARRMLDEFPKVGTLPPASSFEHPPVADVR
jgi:glycosyltransferase involved in cell wall biosynthesis